MIYEACLQAARASTSTPPVSIRCLGSKYTRLHLVRWASRNWMTFPFQQLVIVPFQLPALRCSGFSSRDLQGKEWTIQLLYDGWIQWYSVDTLFLFGWVMSWISPSDLCIYLAILVSLKVTTPTTVSSSTSQPHRKEQHTTSAERRSPRHWTWAHPVQPRTAPSTARGTAGAEPARTNSTSPPASTTWQQT
jgi:hypothetical protein